jgi:hypothetical protein
MRKLILLVGVAFALTATAAFAGTSQSSAEKTCRALQSDASFAANHGGKTFEQFYGSNKNGENAFGECVSDQQQASSATSSSQSTSSQEEQNESSVAEAAEQSASTSTPNPESTEPHHPKPSFAASCRAQRKADPAGFEATYGTNKSKENALGKCVSALAKAQSSH